jgi:hypothetical protein
VRADGADIGLTEAIGLHGANHRVTAAAPEQRKCTLVRHPAFWTHDVIATVTKWYWLFDQLVFAVRHHQVWIAGEFGQARGQSWHHANAGGQNFAIVAPGFGCGGDHEFGEAVG